MDLNSISNFKEIQSLGKILKNSITLQQQLMKPYCYGSLWVYIYQENFKLIKKLCRSVEGKFILDVGCGGGWLLEWFGKEGATVYGLDISPEMCKAAKLRSKLNGVNYEVVCGDAENLPIRDGALDIVTFYAVLHHLPDFEEGLNEAMRAASRIILADEPCEVPLLSFLIIKILRNRVFKRREYSGIEGRRFNIEQLRRRLLLNGYTAIYKKIWSYVPPYFERKERSSFLNLVYKVLHKFLMFPLFKRFGHAFIMIIEPNPQ